jgi:hypothetical protein
MAGRRPEPLASTLGELAALIVVPGDLGGQGSDRGGKLTRWLRADRGISLERRLAVYASAFFERIRSVLRADFGALHAALGDDAFHDLVKLYLWAHPPRGFSLRWVGERLPAFLAAPVAEPFRRRCPFAASLAALEWAIADVFDAPDSPVLAWRQLAAVPPDRWSMLRLEPVAAHRLLSLAWAVRPAREAWESDLPLPPVFRESNRMLVFRRGERVFYRPLPLLEAEALALLGRGASFGALCERVADEVGETEAPRVGAGLVAGWLEDGILSRLWA